MKVGILTFHNVFNPGSFLQAYSTQQLLKSFGHDPYIIDYTTPSHRYSALKKALALKHRFPFCFRYWWDGVVKHAVFERDRKAYYRRTRTFLHHNELAKECFDAIVVGADTVWSFEQTPIGFDPVYYGDFIQSERWISFAPSFGFSKASNAPPGLREKLSRFHAISVRDEYSCEMIKEILGFRPPIVCDPTFHLDISELKDIEGEKSDYLFVYLLPGRASIALQQEVVSFARERNLKIVASLYRSPWADKNLMKRGPFDWLKLLANASYVITNTFHGTVFSILLQKRFAVEMHPKMENKTVTLVSDFNVKNRVFEGSGLADILESCTNYEASLDEANRQRENAYSFLQHSLENDSHTFWRQAKSK